MTFPGCHTADEGQVCRLSEGLLSRRTLTAQRGTEQGNLGNLDTVA